MSRVCQDAASGTADPSQGPEAAGADAGDSAARPGDAHERAAGLATWPLQRREGTSALPAVALALLGTSAVLALLLARNHRYFFVDDRIAETVPKLLDIGRLVRRGQMPWVTTDILNGSGYADEYLNGVFNPLNVALAVVMSRMADLAVASFLYVLVHALLLGGSGAWLARTLGAGTGWSAAVGVSLGAQPYTLFWDATAWSQGLLSFAWVTFTVAAATAFARRPRRRHGVGVLVGVFGTATSGWPHAVLLLGVFLAALVVAQLVARVPLPRVAWLAAWTGAGAVVSLVAVVPLLASSAVAARPAVTENAGNFLVTPVEALLQAADPAYYGFFASFNGYVLQPLPSFYVAWFVLPVVLLVRRVRLPADLVPVAAAGAVSLGVALVGALGPERLAVLRYPMRTVQYVGLFLLVVVTLLAAHGRFRTSRRALAGVLAVLGLLLVNALQVDPHGVVRVLRQGLVVAALVAGLWYLAGRGGAGRRGRRGADALVGVGTVLLLLWVAWLHPAGRGTDYGFPADYRALPRLTAQDRTLFYGTYAPAAAADPAFWQEYRPATTGLITGERQVNGYSSLGNRFLQERVRMEDQGNFSPGSAAAMTVPEAVTGRTALDLMKVDQVVALLGPYDDDLRAALGPQWQRQARRYTAVYRRAASPLPGTASFVPAGTSASRGSCEQTASQECLRVRGGAGGPVVFSRLWVPGYRATLDGRAVDVGQVAGMVAVQLPPGVDGQVRLTYASPGFRPLVALSAVVLLAVALAALRWGGADRVGGDDGAGTAGRTGRAGRSGRAGRLRRRAGHAA